jgi:amino acid permease
MTTVILFFIVLCCLIRNQNTDKLNEIMTISILFLIILFCYRIPKTLCNEIL